MAGAVLRFLHRNCRAPAQRSLELFAPAADHHHLPLGHQFGGARQQMIDHRPPGDRVEDLVQVAFHPRPLARGKNDDCEGGVGTHDPRFASNRLRFP